MSRELFKEKFLPLGIDDFTVYNWFIDEHGRWNVFREGSENISSLTMLHIATTRGKDELLYFSQIAENNKTMFKNSNVVFYDDDFEYALDTDGDNGFSWNGEHTNERRISADEWAAILDEETVTRRFKSGLEVTYNIPDEYFGPNNKYEEHLYTMLDIHELYYTKNKDYGDAFTQSLDKHGPIAALVRMEDKWNRLSNLMSTGTEGYIKNESVEDTLIDLANYAIMTALYLRGNRTDD